MVLNPKFSIIFSVCGFLLSFLVALFSGVPFSVILLRAFLVGAVFFVLSVLIHTVIRHFLPELLNPEISDVNQTGTTIDMTVGDDDSVTDIPYAPEQFADVADDEGGLNRVASSTTVAEPLRPDVADEPPEGGSDDGLGSLPDLDSFSIGQKNNVTDNVGADNAVASSSKTGGASSVEAVSMARAIQTMLAHDD